MSAYKLNRAAAVVLVFSLLHGMTLAQSLSKNAAIALAEKFIAENGYTVLPPEKLKATLDNESMEFYSDRKERLAERFNTLKSKAIGIRVGARVQTSGWSVAFDFVNADLAVSNCRVVTMESNGSNIRVQHVDGIRKYFAGFE